MSMSVSAPTSDYGASATAPVQNETSTNGSNAFDAALKTAAPAASNTSSSIGGAPLGFVKLMVNNIYQQAQQFGQNNGIGPGALISKLESQEKNSSGDPTSQDPNDNTSLDQN